MITDLLKNAELYYGLDVKICTALKYLKQNDFTNMAPGRYQIDGENIYAVVMNYDSKPRDGGSWEAHRRYIDIQYVASGAEQMGYANIDSMDTVRGYEAEGDYLLLSGRGDFFKVGEGCFAIFWPGDVHMPGIALEEPVPVKKVVVKVLV